MDKWTDAVKERMREIDFTQENLAERMGVTQGAVGHWLRAEREPKLHMINQILVEVGLGPLQIGAAVQMRENSAVYGDTVHPTAMTGADGHTHELYYGYPIVNWALIDELPVASTWPRQSSDYAAQARGFWLRVEGDAMTAPVGLSVPEGMLILVDTGLAAEPGKLLIVREAPNAVAIFRQLIEEGGQRYLKPLNPTYPKTLFTEQTLVLGVVVQALMKF